MIIMGGVFLCGCSSYRFQGHVAKGTCISASCAQKYRIGSVVFREDRQFAVVSPWDIYEFYEFNEIRFRRDVMKRNPDLFTGSAKGIPLAVTIRVFYDGRPKDGDISGILRYFLTLGVCPLRIGVTTPCEITVSMVGARNISQSCAFQFREDLKMSAMSPLGWIQFETVPEATSCRRSNGFMTAPGINTKCKEDWEAVFIETVTDGIEVCIREIEKRTPPDVLARLANVPQ
jgi:hypothetical protein